MAGYYGIVGGVLFVEELFETLINATKDSIHIVCDVIRLTANSTVLLCMLDGRGAGSILYVGSSILE